MAISGSYSVNPAGYLKLIVEWTAVQSVTGNYSDVTQKIYLSYAQIEVGSRSNATSSINGTEVTYSTPAIKDYSSGVKNKLLYTHTVRVNHATDGTAKDIPLSASWYFGGTYSGVTVNTILASAEITLDKIDRSAPTVTCTTSQITASSVNISMTASVTCNAWWYSLDNGSTWVKFSTTEGTSVSKQITGLSPNTTYNIKVCARKKTNDVDGYASTSIITLGNSLLNSVDDFTVDVASPVLKMNWTVYANYTHTLVIKEGSTTVLTITGLTCSVGTNNKTVTLTTAQRTTILKYFTTRQEFTATFELSTYSGSTKIGSTVSKTATIKTTSATSAPTISDFTMVDSDANGTVAITGSNQLYIKGYSSLQIQIGSASAKNEATITKYKVTVGSESKEFTTTPIDYGVIKTYGNNIAVKVEVIDSRGYSTSLTKNITVIDYSNIAINDYNIYRKNGIGETVQLSFSGAISPIKINNVAQNGVQSAKFRYALNGGSWSGWNNLTVTEKTNSFEYTTTQLSNSSGVLVFDPEKQYTIEIKLTDRLSSDTLSIILNKGTPLVAFRSKKVGINTADPQSALHITGDLQINDGVVRDYVVERGTSGIWTYEKWNSGIARCWGTTATISFEFKNDWIADTYFNSTSYNLPSGLFTVAPDYVNIQTISTDGLHSNCLYGLDKTKIQWYAMSHGAQSKTRDLKFLLMAVGKWK